LNQDTVKEILTKYRTVAVVGLSSDPSKPSYGVAEYLKNHGYRIVPINPFADEILGEKSYKTLLEVPDEIQRTIEIVDIFRRPEDVPPIVEQVVQMRRFYGVPYVVWMQLGIVNEEAAETARRAELSVVMNMCIRQEHIRLFGG
jgi:predicted CoA-binding protein